MDSRQPSESHSQITRWMGLADANSSANVFLEHSSTLNGAVKMAKTRFIGASP